MRELQYDDLLDLNNLDELLFSPYEFEDIVDVNNPCMDVDPDTHYLNYTAVNSLNECKYFTSMSFEQELKDRYILNSDTFSLFHLNIRSVSKNLNDLELFLSTMSFKLMCLGLSGTWLYIVDCANTSGYNHIYKCRTNRKGGGVLLLLKECISFKVREDISLFNDKFETNCHDSALLAKLPKHLVELGSVLNLRFELEDRLISAVHNSHRSLVA